ncbi:MAG: hypothetical protein GXO79_14140 [Chlorobi bacterium]|nr:hypothetical protein [Chlorobiota bacterium]
MKTTRLIITFIIIFSLKAVNNYAQINLQYINNKTLTYSEAISDYQYLDSVSGFCKLIEYGSTDIGKPLHLFVISKSEDFDPVSLQHKNKRIILINNGIHPGEPCGIDASVQLANDIVYNIDNLQQFLENVVICIIPVYNIGGALSRSCCSRANQNGPEEKGFRGNAKYLDLNRDFIKMDSKNAQSFIEIFQQWQPDVFIDTHTSDGADYQYVMTLLATLHSKLNPAMGNYLKNSMLPWLFERMKKYTFEMTPYVEYYNATPDSGLIASYDPPRFSSGYAALFNTFSFTTESHMLKPFKDRVLGTYSFLRTMIEYVSLNADKIGEIRKQAFEYDRKTNNFPIKWTLDSTHFDSFLFKGYTAEYYTSKITGDKRLFYNHEKPWEKEIPYYAYYKPVLTVEKPAFYIIPQAWDEVIQRLKWNNIKLNRLLKDTVLSINAYYITNYTNGRRSYYWHKPLENIEVKNEIEKVQFYKGDYVINTNQPFARFIVSVLEPQFEDSYFCWNYFESVLHQKEWFSAYVFEDYANELIEKNPQIKSELEALKKENPELVNNSWQQLYFIYKKSKFAEPYLNRYPVYKIYKKINLPIDN